jgi:maltooligosyltrehalose trehalohydrolase
MSKQQGRRYPVGAEIIEGGVSFRVWSPDHDNVELVLENEPPRQMQREEDGYWSTFVPGMKAGDRYRFALSGSDKPLADPVSRYQPDGVSGPSQVIDPASFPWTDQDWRGPDPQAVYYELHIGTFTPEGTIAAAMEKLEWLKDIGITVIELMPINTWVGTFGWGYDGVLLFAPTANYGDPDDVRRFVDQAHAIGMGVILDVVYNHFGPGEICPLYAKDYYSQGPANEWGKSMNFDEPNSGPVREFFCANAAYWIDEFHFDGLRIDATQALIDKSEDNIVAAIARSAWQAAGDRNILLVSENEPQQSYQVRSTSEGGYGLTALWNDDFHHSARVALTGRREAYFHDHSGRAQEFVSAAKYGYLFQGQRYDWQNAQRGHADLNIEPFRFIHFIQNHDQIANTPSGQRVCQLASPAQVRAMTALLLLGPQSPMLFQGQEFNASTPFNYFFDQQEPIATAVWEGRRNFIGQFPSHDQEEARHAVLPPHDPLTMNGSKLDWSEAERNSTSVALHKDLLRIRRETKALRTPSPERSIDGAVLSEHAFLLRYFGAMPEDDRMLIINFGSDLLLRSVPDPLFAPPPGSKWDLCWSSEDVRFGAGGQRRIDTYEPWVLTAHTALFFEPLLAERRMPTAKPEMDEWQRSLRNT